MKEYLSGLLIIIFIVLAASCKTTTNESVIPATVYENIEFKMPEVIVPEFPVYEVNILDFGAVPDGRILNTEAINKAISDVSEKGGGKVIVPRGMWLTGPIVFKSNVNLHTQAGAFILFSNNKDLYPIVLSSFEGEQVFRCQSPLSAENAENIAITGHGIFDGSGDAWRHVKKTKMTEDQWKKLLASGGIVSDNGKTWYPSESFKKGEEIAGTTGFAKYTKAEDFKEVKDFLRPALLHFYNCKNVLFQGVIFQNSPGWNIHPEVCENLSLIDVSIRNPWYSQNGDGIDIESCKNTVVYNCTFDVGDDAICIKSGKNEAGRKRGIPTENLIVKNCIVYHGHGGIVIGSEMSGGVRNMHASNCTFIGTDVGLRFKSNRDRGGVVEDIYISDVDMSDIKTYAISFNLQYGGLSVSEMLAKKEKGEDDSNEKKAFEVTEGTPEFKNIHMKNINCQDALQAIYIQGLPELNVNNITLENSVLYAKKGVTAIDAEFISIKNLHLVAEESPALLLYNTNNIVFEDLEIASDNESMVEVYGEHSNNITIQSSKSNIPQDAVIIEEELAGNSIIVK